jgi:hypothetical protein
MSNKAVLAFPNRLTGRRVSIVIVAADGKMPSPKELRAHIERPLELIKCHKWFFAHHRRQQALQPLGCVVAECSPCGRVRIMLPCVATACQRLVTAPAGVYVMYRTMGRWAAWIMERVTRGRVKKVQVLLQRRSCCAVRCFRRASACVRCVCDACCRKRWPVSRCVAAHLTGCIKCAAAFILMCRLLLPPALKISLHADAALWSRQKTETAFRCFAI